MTPEQVNALKIQVKKWERNFEKLNGRKPNKDDIDCDNDIKQSYIIYWKMIKILKKQETENNQVKENKLSNVWNDSYKKSVKSTKDEQKTTFTSKSKTLNLMSNKLLENELQTKTSSLSYSLNRKNKRIDDENKCIRIHSNQISLLRRSNVEENAPDQFVNLITDPNQQLDTTNYLTGKARYTVDSTQASLNLQSIIKKESDVEAKFESNSNNFFMDSVNDDDVFEIQDTEREIQSEVNSILSKFNLNEIDTHQCNTYTSDQLDLYQPITSNQLIIQPVLSQLSLNDHQTVFDQQSSFVQLMQPTFNQQSVAIIQESTFENSDSSGHSPQFTYLNNMTAYQSTDDVDFGSLMPQLFDNLNSAKLDTFQQDNSNILRDAYAVRDQMTGGDGYTNCDQNMNDFTNHNQIANQYIDLSNSNSLSKTDISQDFSPVKDIPAEKLTFSNLIEDFTNLNHQSNTGWFVNLHGDKEIDNRNDFHVDNLPDVYNFTYEPQEKPSTSKVTKEKRLDVKEMTKQKSKRKKSAYKDLNFKRLDIKKKTYARGYKKFNMKKYKKDEWKKLQEENKCFKCGENNHWAKDCTNVDAELKAIDNDEYDELEEMVSDNLMVNSAQPVYREDQIAEMQIEIEKTLHTLGHESFRSSQKEVIERILMGKSSLMISSTGSGKSLCYQLPAYIYCKKKKYITLVVSPLISLMEDQMLCLPKCVKAVCLHSDLTEANKKANLMKIQSGEAQILFLSPEYILAHMYELSLLPTIGFVCIDEAHCLSEWSNNFRPSYLQFFNVLRNKMKINTFLALTATANKATTQQILKNIGMTLKDDVIGLTRVPDNLVLTISRENNKDFALISLLKSERFNNLKSIIIYCDRRMTTEKIATLIRIEMQKSKDSSIDQEWTACAYHAGLSYQERKRIQKSFVSGKLRVVVATIAFGMGINKSDVDGIIHFSLPNTIENYIQEIGRAGRNGENAQCHIFLDQDSSDLFEQQKHIYSNGIDKKNVKKLTSKLFKPCKCIKLRQFAAQETMDTSQDDITNTDQQSDRCPGHENAFTVKELTEELDIKEETLLTILIYLELNLKNIKIKVMNKTLSTCILSCYKGGNEQLENLAKRLPFIALPLAQLKKDNPTIENQTILRFSYINVASMLGQRSQDVLKKLRSLEWKYEQNRRVKSNIRVAFENLSFHVITPGDLSEQEIQNVAQMILNYNKSQEVLEAKRLKYFYQILKDCSQSKCTNKINSTKSLKLKKILNDYFDLSKEKSDLFEEDNLDDIENLEKIANQSFILKNTNISELEDARRDIRDLINIHSGEYITPRVITRILQGISSPKYPAEVWGKDKRFWRKCIRMDFNILFKLANEELIRIRS